MHSPRLRTLSRRRLAWLLWLALLLPVAQLAATWHSLSHEVGATGSADDGKHAAHATHCDLCVTAAAVHGGALLGTPPAWAHVPLRHVMLDIALADGRVATPARAYRSRAPPHALG